MDIDDEPRTMERPWWVKVGLWGLGSRASAWVFVWLSLAIAVGCVVYGFTTDLRFVFGGLLVFAALWYYLAIRWVDEYGTWQG
jgi:hypothetical protein